MIIHEFWKIFTPEFVRSKLAIIQDEKKTKKISLWIIKGYEEWNNSSLKSRIFMKIYIEA